MESNIVFNIHSLLFNIQQGDNRYYIGRQAGDGGKIKTFETIRYNSLCL